MILRQAGWLVPKGGSLLPDDAIETTYIKSKDLRAYVTSEKSVANAFRDALLISLEERMGGPVAPDTPLEKNEDLLNRSNPVKFEKNAKFQKVYIGGQIKSLFETSRRIAWYEKTEKDKNSVLFQKEI